MRRRLVKKYPTKDNDSPVLSGVPLMRAIRAVLRPRNIFLVSATKAGCLVHLDVELNVDHCSAAMHVLRRSIQRRVEHLSNFVMFAV
jgi:hypothetical protein